jgi:hypothetical protein
MVIALLLCILINSLEHVSIVSLITVKIHADASARIQSPFTGSKPWLRQEFKPLRVIAKYTRRYEKIVDFRANT